MDILHLVLLLNILWSFVTADCPDGFLKHRNSCYHFSSDTGTWLDALDACEKLYGAYLVEIEGPNENNFLTNEANLLGYDYWVGGNDIQVEGEWKWFTSNSDVTYSTWERGNPSNSFGGENCMEIHDSDGTGPITPTWNDETCHAFQRYICEKPFFHTTMTVSPLPTTEETVKVTGTKTNGWTESSIHQKSPQNPDYPINLSVGKPSYQPNTYDHYVANRGNDGDRNGYDMQSCFHTELMFEPFWMVDLEDIFVITRIDLYNRLDYCCSERTRQVEIETAISNDTWSRVWSRVAYYENQIGESVSTDIDNVRARYIKITLKDVKEFLHLCEVEVFGYKATDEKDVKQITTEDSSSQTTVTVSPLSTTEETVKVIGTKTNDWTETSISRKSSENPAVIVSGCPASKDYRGQLWNRGVKGTFSRRPCPSGYKGEVKRYCDKEGVYIYPVYNCTSTTVADIYKKVLEGSDGVKPIIVLNALANVTSAENENNGSIMLGDMDAVIEIMSVVADINLQNMSAAEKEVITDSFMETTSNIIGGSTSNTWKTKMTETGASADVVLDNVDRFLEKLNATDSVEVKKQNLYVKKEPIASCVNRTVFPNPKKDIVPEWMQETRNGVSVGCNNNWNISSFSGIIYRNLSQVIPSSLGSERDQQQQINTPVVSFTFHPNVLGKLRNPVEISFETYSNALEKPICTFWKKGKGGRGYWSRKGCWLHRYNKQVSTVVCKCDHLTNFAVLMSLSSTTAADHQKALNIITKAGLITSSVFLFLTIVVYGIFWRNVKSDHAVIKLNLSCVLFLANLLFLAGVDRTGNKIVCTVIAAFLHLLYLCVFFIMLALGLDLVYMVVKPHSTRARGLHLLFASYGLAVITVGISMGVVQLEGYGNDKVCWISVETGLIWSFLAPVLVVILINLINTVLVIRIMCGTEKMSKGTNKERVKSGIRSVLILMPIMGLTWLFGIFSIDGETVVFQYLFAVFNSLQGVFIFVFHCVMNRNIQVEFGKMRARYLSPETRSTSRTNT